MTYKLNSNFFESIEAVIFDFDGTLYDFKSLPRRLVLGAPLHLFKIKAEREARSSLKGIDLDFKENWQSSFFEKLGEFSKNSKEKAKIWYQNFYCPYMVRILKKHYKIRDCAKNVLELLKKANIPTVLFSDYPMVQERLLAIGGDPKLFDLLVSSEDFGALKPATRPFLEIANKLNINPKNILVIGDRLDTDGIGAKSANMNFIQTESHKFPAGSEVISWKELNDYIENFISKKNF